MTAASLYFNKKIKDVWYFSAPTNQSKCELVIDGMANVKKVPKGSDSVLPNAFFLDMSIAYDGQVVSSPIEAGSYTSYNKTNAPFKIDALLAFDENKGKKFLQKTNVPTLQDTIDKLIQLKKSPIIFNIITPSREFQNVTLEKFDYKLSRENGLGVLFVQATFVEVMQIAVTTLGKEDVKSVDGLGAKDGGTKEAKEPKRSALKKLEDGMRKVADDAKNMVKRLAS